MAFHQPIDTTQKAYVLTPVSGDSLEAGADCACRIDWLDKGEISRTDTLWYKFDQAPSELPEDSDCDAYVLALLVQAMYEGRDISVVGTVSPNLLSNLHEFQKILSTWWAGILQPITIQAEESTNPLPRKEGHILAYSGGLDAMFSAWRHTNKLDGPRSKTVSKALLVHGFDISLDETDRFEISRKTCRETLSELGIELATITTNLRDFITCEWDYAYGAALGSALSLFKGEIGTGMIGSSHVYGKLMPYGSTPLTDPLLGSETFGFLHDGAAYNRTEKAAEIGDWRHGVDRLRVCWESRQIENCGRCEKCIRTKLNFMSSGHEPPDAFAEEFDLKDLRKITLYNDGFIDMWQEMIDMAEAKAIQAPWLRTLKFVLLKARLRRFLKPGAYPPLDL